MHRQWTAADVIRLGTSLADLVEPAIMEMPVAVQLGTTGSAIKALLDLPPCRPPMLLHIAVGDLVRDALVAESRHQPIEHRTGVAIADCCSHLVGPQVALGIGVAVDVPLRGLDRPV